MALPTPLLPTPLLYLTSYCRLQAFYSISLALVPFLLSFHEHGVLLYLSKDLYTAFIKLQADKGLGRSFAGLLPFVEGLYHLGYLSKDVYEKHVRKYSQGLTQKKAVSFAEMKEKEEIKRQEKHYSDVLKQWPQLSASAKAFHKKAAQEWAPKVKNAKLVLELDS